MNYGGNEGIYLDLDLVWKNEDDDLIRHSLGTYKTLDESDDAMYAMSTLLASFTLALNRYVNANLDDFLWDGVNVYPCDKDGNKISGGYTCWKDFDLEREKNNLLAHNEYVAVRDNATRKVKVHQKEEAE